MTPRPTLILAAVALAAPLGASAVDAQAPGQTTRPAPRAVPSVPSAPSARPHRLTAGDSGFLLDGKPFQIISGEMHYPRVPREYWRARMQMARAMGLNTITTYVFWNLHERRPGRFDFTGNLDVAAFVRTAQEEGLFVIVRPGPYVCSEWDLGGLPWWLYADTTLVVRSRDPRFLAAAGRYLDRLGRELAPLLSTRGGPILAVQVENEYGSFDRDSVYMRRIHDLIVHAGFGAALLYTADGPDQLPAGTLTGVPAAVNFGPGDADTAFARLARFRPAGPRMAGEWWAGWFDQWGGRHEVTDAAREARELDWMLSRGYSVNFYMFHGGTTFGLLNGANFDDRNGYRPQTSGYDYDAALDEGGRPSRKFALFRDVIARHSPGVALPEPPAPAPVIAIPRFPLMESVPLTSSEVLGRPVVGERPKTFEALGVDFGYVLYRTRLEGPARGSLLLIGLRDYAVVSLGGRVVGTLDRRLHQASLVLDVPAGQVVLDVLVESTGRVNFGRQLVRDWKGLTGTASFAGLPLMGWEMYRLPMQELPRLRFPRAGASQGSAAQVGASAEPDVAGGALAPTPPTFYRGTFAVDSIGDTWLDMGGWGKGVVWVNGHNLGRFWNIGPQRTLYLPGSWLKRGTNEIVVLDLAPEKAQWVEGVTAPLYDR